MSEINQKLLTDLVIKAIQDIKTEPGLTPEQKAQCIKDMKGIPKEVMYEYLNSNYRTAMSIASWIPKNRKKGISETAISKKSVMDKLKSLNRRPKNNS